MKLNRIALSLTAMAAMALASCQPGQYWDEVSNPDTVYAFDKSQVTLSYVPSDEIPSTYTVQVTRSAAGPAATLEVEFETKSPLLSGPETVTFADGSMTADYVVSIEEGIQIGTKHSATITLVQPDPTEGKTEVVIPEDNEKFSFIIGMDYTWKNVAVANMISSFAGNKTPVEVPVQQAMEYDSSKKLLRFLSPYYIMDPDYSDEGYNIQFVLDAANNEPIGLSPAWQYTGESDDGDYFFLGLVEAYGSYFKLEDGVYTLYGIMAAAASPNGGSLSPAYYETMKFELNWNN